jgi:hypothetical protein
MKDSKSLLVKMLPGNRSSLINTSLSIPSGPTISVNEMGQKAQNRTYQDLLKDGNDEHNFEVLAQSEIHMIGLDGNSIKWKDAGMYSSMTRSPDGKYIIIGEINRPFSYLVTYGRFPTSYNVYDILGNLVKNVVDVPLTEELPKGFMSTRKGIRSLQWRDDQSATLVWAEALDGVSTSSTIQRRKIPSYKNQIKI